MAKKQTKKELKELQRMEREQRAKRTQLESTSRSSEDTMKWITLGVVATIVVGLFGFIIFNSQQRQAQRQELANVRAEISDTGWTKGATESAEVTLVEFADFQCPGCRANEPFIDQALEEYDGQLRFVYKHFPLTSIHQNAKGAAIAAEAAGNQEKFWEMHDLLFEKQPEWSALGVAEARTRFTEYAQQIGLNVQQFTQDLEDPALEERVTAQQDEGANLGVMGTPTFFVNGKRVESGNYTFLKNAIDAELQNTNQE